jgi:UDP-N-acetylglucosamine 2-epimerase (non-hydrolysing)
MHSKLVFTDSGGVQQEACIHHVPAVTLRENTEWIETLECGANRLAGTDPARIVKAAGEAMTVTPNWTVPFGDGTAAAQMVRICQRVLEKE